MNVSLQNIDKVSAELTVKLEKADYQEKVDKELRTLRQKVDMPGFRKGMVPASLVKKMYGKSVIAEVVNKTLQEAVYNYIKENKVNMLGEPLPNEEKQQNIDFDTMDEFDFVFDIALAPEFKAEVSAKDKVDYYTIEVSDEMIDNQVKMYTQRTGKYDTVDTYQDNDMLKGLLAQLDEEGNTKEGGIQVEGAVMMPSYMKNDEQKAIFANAKVNDVLVFNPNVAFDGNETELGSLLKIDKNIAKDVKSNFSFQVEEITRFVAGELNQELFDQAFGEGVVKTEEEFRAKIKEEIASFLYMGIVHDTGVFQYSCTSPETMEVGAALLRKGIYGSAIIDGTYFEKSYVQNQMLGKALLESMMILNKKAVVSVIRLKEMEFFQAKPSDLDGIVSVLRQTRGVDVAILLYELEPQTFKVSLRSKEIVDVSAVAKYYGGGGHVRAAGVTMKGSPHDVINNLTLLIERQLRAAEEKNEEK